MIIILGRVMLFQFEGRVVLVVMVGALCKVILGLF